MNALFHLRKRHVTLLETLIAVSLLSLLLMVVFAFFRELSQITSLSEQAQKESFQMRYLESRLGFIFERIVNENASSRTFYFYTQPPQASLSSSASLIFTFDNGVRRDPFFSGDVLGRLYLDQDHRLCLAIWPLRVAEPHQFLQEEVLCHDVVNLTYAFYAAPPRSDAHEIVGGQPTDPEKKTPKRGEWQEEWLLSYEQMPAIIKIIVQVAQDPQQRDNVKELVFSFVLPSSKNPVYYAPH